MSYSYYVLFNTVPLITNSSPLVTYRNSKITGQCYIAKTVQSSQIQEVLIGLAFLKRISAFCCDIFGSAKGIISELEKVCYFPILCSVFQMLDE